MKEPRSQPKYYIPILVALATLGVLAPCLSFVLPQDTLDRLAKVGDFFGLFAFFGVLLALKLQGYQIELQKGEMAENSEALKETIDAQKEAIAFWKLEQQRIHEAARLILRPAGPWELKRSDARSTTRKYLMENVGGSVREIHIASLSNSGEEFYSFRDPGSLECFSKDLEYSYPLLAYGEPLEIFLTSKTAGATNAKATLRYLNSLGIQKTGELFLNGKMVLEFTELTETPRR